MSHGPRARRASSAPPTSRRASPPANEAQASGVVGKLILVQTVEVSVVLLGSGSNEGWLGRAPATTTIVDGEKKKNEKKKELGTLRPVLLLAV
ncbi:hypothetical protein PENPOL_c003G04818 [Penicillium polonicum]|uniref:Uncharacterized protein n=1 Tax=Penicillium polonicum TaxID=60169 RepID=A0A1V6NUH5_PENPO|nr:hypothetical protein PENPOL_c003G04818 [Penicillium polonicum]